MIDVIPADQMGCRPVKPGDHTLVAQFIEEDIVLEGYDVPTTIHLLYLRLWGRRRLPDLLLAFIGEGGLDRGSQYLFFQGDIRLVEVSCLYPGRYRACRGTAVCIVSGDALFAAC